jgi:thiamine pyrophosphate-dependent acetolactate synthase large subunit-like protein
MVRHGYRLIMGGDAEFDTPLVDFAAWATAIGARGRRITRAGEVTAALLDELTAEGLPVVLDVRQDADVRIRGDGRIEARRIEAIRQMSMGQKAGGDRREGES